MALISLIQISKQFDYKKILDEVSFTFNENERVAIVGKNGSGKSTLLKILNGEIQADSGERAFKTGLQILSLAQNSNFTPGKSVREVCLESLEELLQIHHRIQHINITLAKESKHLDSQNNHNNYEPTYRALLDELGKLSNILDNTDGWNLEQKVEDVLKHFSLKEFENRIACTLSGGEQKRLALAQILLQRADVYILDEPTNHLDVQAVEFLEEKILSLKASVVFISHDRYFVDRIAQRIVEVDNTKILNFSGGYTQYLEQKAQILANLTKEHTHLLKLLKAEEEWLAKGVQARRKRNEGRKERLMELRKSAKHNPALINKMRLELERESKHFYRQEGKNAQKMIFECENINLRFYDKALIQNFSLRILQHDRIAIVGKNGSGKSTLLKILLGKITPDSGTIKRGELHIGYFDQHREMLDDSKSLIETFCPNGGDHIEVRGKNIHVFGYLKNFLFPKEMLDKKIAALSGGEKNRVALALLFTKHYDCLILDEPTNDLDIATINILEEYLASFDGALIFVSHDRYFVDKLAKKLLIFEPITNHVQTHITESYMLYSEYLDMQKELREYKSLQESLEQESKIESKMEDKTKNQKDSTTNQHNTTTESKKPKKLSYKENLELQQLPKEIQILESQIKSLESELSDSAVYLQKGIATIATQLEQAKEMLESKYERYFELEEKCNNL